MSISSKKLGQDALRTLSSSGNTGNENPCLITSVTDLTPQKICDCATQLLQQISTIKTMLQNPENIVTCIWPSDSFLYGPENIGSSPGWWFSVYRPILKMDSEKLSIVLKCGVKKTRGVLQFPWRKASHTFEINIPAEISQHQQAITEIEKIEDALNTIKQNICQFAP